MEKTIIAIGGGEIKSKQTLEIDRYIAEKVKARNPEKRPCGLFIPTASHDSMPYYNSFHKTYTGVFNIKTDVALTVYGEMNYEKIRSKFEKADFIYVGGGDTVFMIEHWKKTGMYDLILDAYNRGVLICGLSAGAICWFETMYTDSPSLGTGEEYNDFSGLNWIFGKISPHYNLRMLDFDRNLIYNKQAAWALEDCSAIEIVNGEVIRSITCGGKAYFLDARSGEMKKTEI